MTMPTGAAEIVAAVPRSGYDARLSGTRGTFRFDVTGAGTWRLLIEDGHFEVLEGPGDADLVLASDERTFVRLVGGTQNLVTALLQGLVRTEGNLALALKFHGLVGNAPVQP